MNQNLYIVVSTVLASLLYAQEGYGIPPLIDTVPPEKNNKKSYKTSPPSSTENLLDTTQTIIPSFTKEKPPLLENELMIKAKKLFTEAQLLHISSPENAAVLFSKALPLLSIAGKHYNNSDAQYWVGYCYEHGLGTPCSIMGAIPWYEKAAENDHDLANANLNLLYHNFDGSLYKEEFNTLALKVRYFHPTGEDLFWYASFFHYGWSGKKDIDLAIAFYEKSGKKGYRQAYNTLGIYFEEKEMPLKAFEYYQQAINMGSNSAKENLENLRKELIQKGNQDKGTVEEYQTLAQIYEGGILDNQPNAELREIWQKKAKSLAPLVTHTTKQVSLSSPTKKKLTIPFTLLKSKRFTFTHFKSLERQ